MNNLNNQAAVEQQTLVRKEGLSKSTATLFTAAMILGTGLFVSLGATAWDAGSGTLVAIVIGGLICLSTGISAAQVGINHPVQGGAFIWMRIFGHPKLSFIAGCAYIIEGILGLGIVALGFATYSAQIFPDLSIPLTASLSLIAVATLNILGISPVSKLMIGIFFVVTFFLGVYVILAIPSIEVKNFTPILGDGIGSVFAGAATFFWTWGGFQRMAIMAGDVPLYVSAAKVMGVWGAGLILALATISFFSEMLGDLLATSKVQQTMGQVGELPHWFAIANARFKSPHFALISLTIVGVLFVSFVPIRQLMPIASAGTLIWYGATNASALLLTKEQRFVHPIFSWVGIASCVGLFCLLPAWSISATVILTIILLIARWAANRFIKTKEIAS